MMRFTSSSNSTSSLNILIVAGVGVRVAVAVTESGGSGGVTSSVGVGKGRSVVTTSVTIVVPRGVLHSKHKFRIIIFFLVIALIKIRSLTYVAVTGEVLLSGFLILGLFSEDEGGHGDQNQERL